MFMRFVSFCAMVLRPSKPVYRQPKFSLAETLESRTLLSETASAQLHLVSTSGTPSSPVYNYNITLTDTGTTNLGTFWFGWVPGEDLLPSVPPSAASPSGWGNADGVSSTPAFVGAGNSADGVSIQWVAQSAGAALTPGQSLGGFTFSSHDSPATLAGQSPSHPPLGALTSFVYIGAPETDSGYEFAVAGVPAGSSTSKTTLAPSAPSITAGDSLTLTATVASVPPGGATPTGMVTFLDNGTAIGAAPVQGNGTAVFSTTALPAGADALTATYGGDTTYGASSSTGIVETVNPAPVKPTLAPSIAKSTLPAAVVAGAATHGVIAVAVTNQSASLVKGPVTVEIFASTDGAIDGSATLVAHITRTLSLKPGRTVVISLPIKSLPASLPNGDYTLLAQTTDPSSSTNASMTGPAVTVAAPFIALTESFTKLTLPSTFASGTKLHAVAAIRIVNNGNIASSGPTIIGIYAATDGAVDGSAKLIRSLTRSLRIQPGKSVVASMPLTSASALTAGQYVIIAQVIDPQQHASSANSGQTVTVTA